jgi:hypothetical protein
MKAGRTLPPRMMMIMITWIVIKMITSEKSLREDVEDEEGSSADDE